MGLRISELNESQLAELEKKPHSVSDHTPFQVEILKNVELSREEILKVGFMKPFLTANSLKSLPN